MADLNEYDELLIDAAAGQQLEIELAQEGGTLRRVLDKMHADAADALDRLIRASPADLEEVRELQYRARRYRDMMTYLHEIDAEGEQAHDQLSQDETDYDLSPQSFPREPVEQEVSDA